MDGQLIVSTVIPEERRAQSLESHFGSRISLLVENDIFTCLRRLAPDYRCAYWQFYELSNGGFYMAPEVEPLRVRVGTAGFYERMSADAAGVVACLRAFGNLFLGYDEELPADKYHSLRDFAAQHPEASKILGKERSCRTANLTNTCARHELSTLQAVPAFVPNAG